MGKSACGKKASRVLKSFFLFSHIFHIRTCMYESFCYRFWTQKIPFIFANKKITVVEMRKELLVHIKIKIEMEVEWKETKEKVRAEKNECFHISLMGKYWMSERGKINSFKIALGAIPGSLSLSSSSSHYHSARLIVSIKKLLPNILLYASSCCYLLIKYCYLKSNSSNFFKIKK